MFLMSYETEHKEAGSPEAHNRAAWVDYLDRAALFILLAALLVGIIWSGGYFPTPKWTLVLLLFLAAACQLPAVLAGRGIKTINSPAIWCFAAFTIFAGASFFWSQTRNNTFREAALMAAYLCALFVARSQVVAAPRKASTILNWLIYTAFFAAMWGIITYLLRVYPYVALLDGFLRAGSTFEYSNAFSCFVLMALPAALSLHQDAPQKQKPLFATVAALLTASALLAFSRLGLILLIGIAAYFLFTSWNRRLFAESALIFLLGGAMGVASLVTGEAERGGIGVIILLALAAASYFLHSFAAGKQQRALLKKILTVFSFVSIVAAAVMVAASDRAQLIISKRFGEGLTWDRLIPHRQDTWIAAYHAFQARAVKGWGLGAFPVISARYQTAQFTKFAHNVVLQMAVDTGVAGAILFSIFWIYVVALSALRLALRSGIKQQALAIAMLVFIIYNLFDWEWYIPSLTAWFMVLLACLEVNPPDAEGLPDD